MFFTFWGLFPLIREEVRFTGDSAMQKMLSTMHRGGINHLRTSQLNFAGAGPLMMRALARQHNVASPADLLEMAKDLGVKLIPCQMTMDMLGISKEDLIDGLESPAGATTALLQAQGATTLFI